VSTGNKKENNCLITLKIEGKLFIYMIQQHVMDQLFVDFVNLVVVVMSSMLIVYQFDHEPEQKCIVEK
jgi:hypothetical protein